MSSMHWTPPYEPPGPPVGTSVTVIAMCSCGLVAGSFTTVSKEEGVEFTINVSCFGHEPGGVQASWWERVRKMPAHP